MGRQIPVALLDRIEARLGAEDGEPGCPDVGRDQIGVRPALQGDLQQVARIEPQDRPAVRRQVADRPELLPQARRRLQVGGVDQVVDLAGPLPLFVDRGNLHLQEEPERSVAGRGKPALHLALDLWTEAEQPGLGRHQLRPDLLEPGWMGEVASAHDRDSLAPRPERQVLQIRIVARGARVLRMDVEIGVEDHDVGERNLGDDTAPPQSCPPTLLLRPASFWGRRIDCRVRAHWIPTVIS
jgi:hypothetical protein